LPTAVSSLGFTALCRYSTSRHHRGLISANSVENFCEVTYHNISFHIEAQRFNVKYLGKLVVPE